MQVMTQEKSPKWIFKYTIQFQYSSHLLLMVLIFVHHIWIRLNFFQLDSGIHNWKPSNRWIWWLQFKNSIRSSSRSPIGWALWGDLDLSHIPPPRFNSWWNITLKFALILLWFFRQPKQAAMGSMWMQIQTMQNAQTISNCSHRWVGLPLLAIVLRIFAIYIQIQIGIKIDLFLFLAFFFFGSVLRNYILHKYWNLSVICCPQTQMHQNWIEALFKRSIPWIYPFLHHKNLNHGAG